MNPPNSIVSFLNAVAAVLEKIINFCCCILLCLIAIPVIIQVFCRSFNIPVVWLGELSTYSVIWVVFLGLAIGYRHGLFAQVDMICHVVPKSWNKYLAYFWDIVGLVIMALILWSSRDYIAHVARRKMLSPEMQLPLWFVYLGPVIGYILTSYFTVVNIVNRFFGHNQKEETA